MNKKKLIFVWCLGKNPLRQCKGRKSVTSVLEIVILLLVGLAGCSVLKPIDQKNSEPDKPALAGELSAEYHNFDDILIPSQLKIDKKTSSVFETENLVAGVISLKGRIDVDTLVEFFKSNMNKDNWSAVSMFKGPRTILLFEKGSRWCVITVTNGQYDPHIQVEIWVTPKSDEIASGLLK